MPSFTVFIVASNKHATRENEGWTIKIKQCSVCERKPDTLLNRMYVFLWCVWQNMTQLRLIPLRVQIDSD